MLETMQTVRKGYQTRRVAYNLGPAATAGLSPVKLNS